MAGRAGRTVVVMLLSIWTIMAIFGCADETAQAAQEDEPAPPPADYDGPATPSEEPIEVLLRVSGSEGGVYKGWHHTEEESDFEDALNSIHHTDKPHFKDVIGPRPKEYRFDLGDGIYEDAEGDVVWDAIRIEIERAKKQGDDWEGEINAELIVDGEAVACSGTEPPFDSFGLSWSLEDKDGGFFSTLNCDD